MSSKCAQCDEYVANIKTLLDENSRLTKAINEMPEFERAVKAASSAELALLRAALKEACDIADSWMFQGRVARTGHGYIGDSERVAEFRKLTTDE